MKITEFDVRCCHYDGSLMEGHEGRDAQAKPGMEFLVYTLTCEDGSSASMFGFAGRSALGAGHLAAASLRDFFVGRNALDREKAWQDWRTADRWWHHLPIYTYGPVDCCLWLLGAQAAQQLCGATLVARAAKCRSIALRSCYPTLTLTSPRLWPSKRLV